MEHLSFIFFSSAKYCRQPIKLYDINESSASKKEKFRGLSAHLVVFRELIYLFTKYRKWGKHIYDFV